MAFLLPTLVETGAVKLVGTDRGEEQQQRTQNRLRRLIGALQDFSGTAKVVKVEVKEEVKDEEPSDVEPAAQTDATAVVCSSLPRATLIMIDLM